MPRPVHPTQFRLMGGDDDAPPRRTVGASSSHADRSPLLSSGRLQAKDLAQAPWWSVAMTSALRAWVPKSARGAGSQIRSWGALQSVRGRFFSVPPRVFILLVAVSPHDRVPRRLGARPPPRRRAAPRGPKSRRGGVKTAVACPCTSPARPAPPPPRRAAWRHESVRAAPGRAAAAAAAISPSAWRVSGRAGEAPVADAPARRQSARHRRQEPQRRAEAGPRDAAPGPSPRRAVAALSRAGAAPAPRRRRRAPPRAAAIAAPERRRTRRPPGRRKRVAGRRGATASTSRRATSLAQARARRRRDAGTVAAPDEKSTPTQGARRALIFGNPATYGAGSLTSAPSFRLLASAFRPLGDDQHEVDPRPRRGQRRGARRPRQGRLRPPALRVDEEGRDDTRRPRRRSFPSPSRRVHREAHRLHGQDHPQPRG